MSYTYFIASLPTLDFDSVPAVTEDAFKARCEEQLSAADFRALCALLDGTDSSNAAVKKWKSLDAQLRNACARIRATRLEGIDATKWLKSHQGFSVWVEQAITAAFQESDPMKRETAIARLRWALADELAGTDTFSTAAIFAYAIKLGIAHRRAAINAELGAQRLQQSFKK